MIRRDQVDRIIRAAALATRRNDLVLVGSTNVFAHAKRIPADMLQTTEVDLFSPDPSDVLSVRDIIDAATGQGSEFERTYGAHGDAVDPSGVKLPRDWQSRAKTYQTQFEGVTATAPDVNDIAIAKLMAWREKDKVWIASGVRMKILSHEIMCSRAQLVDNANIPPAEVERRLDEVERFTGRPGQGPRIHQILNQATSIGPGSEDGLVRVTWVYQSQSDDEERQAVLMTYPAMAKDLAIRAWALRDLEAVQAWEASGRKARTKQAAPSRKDKELDL